MIMIPKFIEEALETLKPVFDQKFKEITTRLDSIDGRLVKIEELLKKKGE